MKRLKKFKKYDYNITNTPDDFFNDLEQLFMIPQFQNFLKKYIYNNYDFDIFSKIFILYFLIYIQTEHKDSVTQITKEALNKQKPLLEIQLELD